MWLVTHGLLSQNAIAKDRTKQNAPHKKRYPRPDYRGPEGPKTTEQEKAQERPKNNEAHAAGISERCQNKQQHALRSFVLCFVRVITASDRSREGGPPMSRVLSAGRTPIEDMVQISRHSRPRSGTTINRGESATAPPAIEPTTSTTRTAHATHARTHTNTRHHSN